jgi:hypothetical protein
VKDEHIQTLPAGVDLYLEPPAPPAVKYRDGSFVLIVDGDRDGDGGVSTQAAGADGSTSTTWHVRTGAPVGGLAPDRLPEPGPLRHGTARWHAWTIAGDGRPLAHLLSVGDPRSSGVAVLLPTIRLLLLGDADGSRRGSGTRADAEHTLLRTLAAIDAGAVDRVSGSDARLRTAPSGDDARARLLAVLSDLRNSSYPNL